MIGLVYQQHQHHYMAECFSPSINPIEKFRSNLVTQLRQWRSLHKFLILFIDANKNTADSPLNSVLSALVFLWEKVFILYILPCHKLPPSSEGTGLEGTQLMPCTLLWIFCWRPVLGFQIIGSPRDHHSCIIEICWKALVGEDMFKIAHPDAHRLSSSAYHSTVEYSRILTLYKFNTSFCLSLTISIGKLMPPSHKSNSQDWFESIDWVKLEGMVHAEKKCHPLKMGEVDFCPDVNTAKGWHFV
jgi:hypothetical protein